MKDENFQELLESVRQAGQIRRGEIAASRAHIFPPQDIRAIRDKLGLSQAQFSSMIGISLSTLQNWEQGRRRPEGPARALLRVAEVNPKVVLEALTSLRREAREG